MLTRQTKKSWHSRYNCSYWTALKQTNPFDLRSYSNWTNIMSMIQISSTDTIIIFLFHENTISLHSTNLSAVQKRRRTQVLPKFHIQSYLRLPETLTTEFWWTRVTCTTHQVALGLSGWNDCNVNDSITWVLTTRKKRDTIWTCQQNKGCCNL